MRWIPVLVFLWLIPGCGVRGQVRSATLAVLDALDHPDPTDRLAVKTRLLAERYVDAALKASDGKSVGTISGEVVEGVMKALSARMSEEGKLVEALVSEAVQATFDGVERRLSSRQNSVRRMTAEFARSAWQTTGAAVGGATKQLFGQVERGLGSDGHGPPAEALTASMQRTTDPPPRRGLGNNLRRFRLAAGLTQQEVADRAALDLRHFQKCEAGENNVTITTLAKLGRGVGVDPATLLERPPRR